MATIWWNATLANASNEHWRKHGLPERGEYGGTCNHQSCVTTGADWFNKASAFYYCDDCARKMNEMCLSLGTSKLCELHV